MTEISKKSRRQTSKDLSNVTFSQALAGGLTHCGWLIGPTTDPPGQEAALVSHSVSQEKAQALMTLATYGPLFGGSSPTDALQCVLANKLLLSLDGVGSTEYVLTWKHWDMQSGPPICALRASAHRKSGNGRGGWPTPTTKRKAGGEYKDPHKAWNRAMGPHANDLRDFAQLAGWPTPNTPQAREADPSAGDPKHKRSQKGPEHIGQLPDGMTAEMASGAGYRLNPRFSLWLMGYPEEWASCGERAMQSCRKSRRK